MFRYVTNAEAQVEYDRRLAELAKKSKATPTDDKKPADKTPATTPPEAPKQAPPAAATAAPAKAQ